MSHRGSCEVCGGTGTGTANPSTGTNYNVHVSDREWYNTCSSVTKIQVEGGQGA